MFLYNIYTYVLMVLWTGLSQGTWKLKYVRTVALAEQDKHRSVFSEVRCLVNYKVNELRLLSMHLLLPVDVNLPAVCSYTPLVQAAFLELFLLLLTIFMETCR